MKNLMTTLLSFTALLSVAFVGHVVGNQQTVNIAIVGIIIYGAWLVFAALPLVMSSGDKRVEHDDE